MQRNPHSYQIATGYRTFYSLSLIYQPITKKRLFFGKKENISIHELADKGAEWGLFLSDSNTPLSAKTIEIELGEIWRGEHLQKVMEKKSKNKNKDKK